ncbi:GNAT family N-acetyltransferase [Microbacterium sp. XT11]|uniref:GNAT family N-acetyltransferase n=1 Tax=Microbacterium sp. XT11 TaxID=367477 RepID=UPI000742E6AB|nr:GNAT family N-acetyltransferase [Microbacterium sp. XT11]ALX66114.1 hypothetical protein AB663_001024 [Microbacterium sp. XT11]
MSGDAVIRPATAADEPALARLWAAAFTPPLAPDQWLVDARRHKHTLVAEDADGLCGSIYGVPKRLRERDGGTAAVHAIGSVAVDARARGRGLARRLVAASLQTAGDADWALLFTGTPEVYRSSGFETFAMDRVLAGPWRAPSAAEGAAGVPAGTGDGVLRRRIGANGGRPSASGAAVLPDAVRIAYEHSREGLVLAPVRREVDWEMAAVRLRGALLYTHETTDSAYVVATIRGTTGVVCEAALPTDADADGIRHALLTALAADWEAADVTDCDIAVPARPGDEGAFAGFAPEARRLTDHTGMTRALRRRPRLDGIRHFTEADYF